MCSSANLNQSAYCSLTWSTIVNKLSYGNKIKRPNSAKIKRSHSATGSPSTGTTRTSDTRTSRKPIIKMTTRKAEIARKREKKQEAECLHAAKLEAIRMKKKKEQDLARKQEEAKKKRVDNERAAAAEAVSLISPTMIDNADKTQSTAVI
jgi:hypothetical protein